MSFTICRVCKSYLAISGSDICHKCWRSGHWLDPLIDKLSDSIDKRAEPAPKPKRGKAGSR